MGRYQKTVVAPYWTYAQITFEVLKARAHSGQMAFVSWWHFDLEGANAYRIEGMVMYRGNRGRRLNKYWRPMTSQKDSERAGGQIVIRGSRERRNRNLQALSVLRDRNSRWRAKVGGLRGPSTVLGGGKRGLNEKWVKLPKAGLILAGHLWKQSMEPTEDVFQQ
ncbi:conserved hypothetical protein [Histoplasma capsulatum var. duboisii H88]|uniref:Uncharacterized protein n=2 Tax=Ajellomyces capsulatus TaxID=5037 RepID=F0UNB4_AJEC8|nr:conserved hypothetical protein [Histoplasma capsulatum var. duboisii H88]